MILHIVALFIKLLNRVNVVGNLLIPELDFLPHTLETIRHGYRLRLQGGEAGDKVL